MQYKFVIFAKSMSNNSFRMSFVVWEVIQTLQKPLKHTYPKTDLLIITEDEFHLQCQSLSLFSDQRAIQNKVNLQKAIIIAEKVPHRKHAIRPKYESLTHFMKFVN